ncbi:helix-turn-helix domain-containing protein [Actinomadura sp. CNU-125]|uniref:MarR family transcriptional regulator n=1 Tax=Actinomadura sp. CNU-125 TaxID=1904961 RepID=UPI0029167FCF|nr:helix-turn-helix domain-containing protein [Actinomadura sp. CNU-125]
MAYVNIAEAEPSDRVRRLPSWLINVASVHSHRLVFAAFAAAGARGYHYRLLAALEEHGPASQADLGRRTGIDRSDVVAALNELAAGHHVRRTPDPADRAATSSPSPPTASITWSGSTPP